MYKLSFAHKILYIDIYHSLSLQDYILYLNDIKKIRKKFNDNYVIRINATGLAHPLADDVITMIQKDSWFTEDTNLLAIAIVVEDIAIKLSIDKALNYFNLVHIRNFYSMENANTYLGKFT